MKILKQYNKKGALNSTEKKRFQQIGEQFFKGSYEFFVHYQETIHKTVDIQVINSNFVQYFQNQLQDAKNKLVDKAQILEEEKAKEKFQNRLLNFIISLEVGIIAILKLPMDFKKIKEYGDAAIDGIVGGWNLLKNSAGVWVDLTTWCAGTFSGIIKNVTSLIEDACIYMVNGVDYFLNYSGVFSECFEHLAIKIGKRATGLVGMILRTLMWFIKDESYKRPNIRHWLLYGEKEYNDVKALEDELYNTVVNSDDTSSIFDQSFRDFLHGLFGYEGYRDKVWGVFVGNSNARIGKYVVDEIDEDGVVKKYKWVGVDAGKSSADYEMELEDVKKALNDLQILVQEAVKSESEIYSVKSMYAQPNLLESDYYKNKIPAKIKELTGKEVDMTIYEDEKFLNLMISSNSDQTKNSAEIKELINREDIVFKFYNQYKNSKDPFAKQICAEIYDKLFEKNEYSREIIEIRTNESFGVRIKSFIFIPPIYYAILQFNYSQLRNEKIVASMDRKLYALNEDLNYYTKDRSLKEYKTVEKRFLDGTINFTDFVKWVVKSLNGSNFTMKQFTPGAILGFVQMAKKSKDIVDNGFSTIYKVKSGDKKYRAYDYVEITKNDIKTFDEIQVGNSEELVTNISENHKVVKENLAVAYKNRTKLLNRIKDKIINLNEKGVFMWDIHIKEGLDGALKKLKEEQENEIKKLEQDKRYQGRWNQRELAVAKRVVYAKYGVKERELKDKYKKLNKK